MIKLTNELNLPMPIVVWLLDDDYDYNPDPKVISATSLIKSTKKTILSSTVARSENIQVNIDVSSKLASIRGQNLHGAIESANMDKAKVAKIAKNMGEFNPEVRMEERLYADLEVDGVIYTISGKFDAIINGILHDWKTESTYSFGDVVKERDRKIQLSIYAWLCVKNNVDVDTKKAVYYSIYQNWMKGMASKLDANKYPKAPMMEFEVQLTPFDVLEFWMKDVIRERNALSVDDANEILCSREDLWMDSPTYQYFPKPDSKRASKNFDTLSDAQAFLASKNGIGLIKEKPLKAKACEYCLGFAICSQYQTLLNNGQIENESIPIVFKEF